MKRFAFIVALCLLAGVSRGTFELEDPARIVEDDETALENEAPENISKAAVNKVIIPPGVNLIQPQIENHTCVSFSEDFSDTTADGKPVSFTAKTYLGVIIDTIECPLADPSAEASMKVALIKTAQGQLIWVDSSKTLVPR